MAVKGTVARNELIYAHTVVEFDENWYTADRRKENTRSRALNRLGPFLTLEPVEEIRDAAGNQSSFETASIKKKESFNVR